MSSLNASGQTRRLVQLPCGLSVAEAHETLGRLMRACPRPDEAKP